MSDDDFMVLIASWGRLIRAGHYHLGWTDEEIADKICFDSIRLKPTPSDIREAIDWMDADARKRRAMELAERRAKDKQRKLYAKERKLAREKYAATKAREDELKKATARRQMLGRPALFGEDENYRDVWFTYHPGPDPRMDFMEPVQP